MGYNLVSKVTVVVGEGEKACPELGKLLPGCFFWYQERLYVRGFWDYGADVSCVPLEGGHPGEPREWFLDYQTQVTPIERVEIKCS